MPYQTLALILVGLTLSACATSTPEPDVTPFAADLPTPLGALEPIASDDTPRPVTPGPTLTPSLTPTASLTPAPTLTAPPLLPMPQSSGPLQGEGPWYVFRAGDVQGEFGRTESYKLWAIDAAGTALTRLSDGPIENIAIQPVANPDGTALIAYVSYLARGESGREIDWVLTLMSLPGANVVTSIPLIEAGRDDATAWRINSALSAYSALRWSHDGRSLAFLSAYESESVDLFKLDVETLEITRLSSGVTHAYGISWSPDDRFVLHNGFYEPGMGGPIEVGEWAARADGGGSIELFSEENDVPDQDEIHISQWLDGSRAIAVQHYDPTSERGYRLLIIDLLDGSRTTIIDGYTYGEYAPEHDTWLLPNLRWSEQGPTLLLRAGVQQEIPLEDLESAWWWPQYDRFVVVGGPSGFYTVSVDGVVEPLPAPASLHHIIWPSPIPSPDGAFWLWHLGFSREFAVSGLWVGEPFAEPRQIASFDDNLDREIYDLAMWSPDSQRIIVVGGGGLWIAERPDFRMVLQVEGFYGTAAPGFVGGWLPLEMP